MNEQLGQEGTVPSVLVAYARAPDHGQAHTVAGVVGRTLQAAGVRADVRAADEVTRVGGYDAVVLGSDLGDVGWLPEAAELLESFQEDLATRPLWLFSSCRKTPGSGRPERLQGVSPALGVLADTTRPLGVGLFHDPVPDRPDSIGVGPAAWALTIAGHLRGGPSAPEHRPLPGSKGV